MEFQESKIRVEEFADMGLPVELLAAVTKAGFIKPTAIQCESIPAAMAGSDLIGIAQTGSGKTLAYALAILSHLAKKPESRALVLVPNRENADQVYRVFAEIGGEKPVTSALASTGVSNKELLSKLKKNPRLIVASPGRLVEQLQNNKLLLKGLDLFVLDEADRMLDMGFGTQLNFIQSTLRGTRQTLMFGASFGAWAEPVAKLFLNSEAVLIKSAGAGSAVETLAQTVLFLSNAQKSKRLLDAVKKMQGGVIIFADSKENCVTIGRLLEHHEFSSDFVHGDMNPGHRNRVLREFREEKIQILITTDLLARGIDVAHVKHVISYDLPYKGEEFLHRIGRTARAGREGSALTFVTPADGRTYRKMKPYLQGATEETVMTNFKFLDRD
jgi:superfamily II DNA/RNA helicase